MSSPEMGTIHLTRPAKLRLTFPNVGSKITTKVTGRNLTNQNVHTTTISESPHSDTVLEVDLPPAGTVLSFYRNDSPSSSYPPDINPPHGEPDHPATEPLLPRTLSNRPDHPATEPPLVSIEVL